MLCCFQNDLLKVVFQQHSKQGIWSMKPFLCVFSLRLKWRVLHGTRSNPKCWILSYRPKMQTITSMSSAKVCSCFHVTANEIPLTQRLTSTFLGALGTPHFFFKKLCCSLILIWLFIINKMKIHLITETWIVTAVSLFVNGLVVFPGRIQQRIFSAASYTSMQLFHMLSVLHTVAFRGVRG